ncbi:hypothetical protein [Actinomycetospora lemnae]|uniref:Uncharacterized protein n=1 Tax=Actinomycetospora lemnae TaxID=3019891 RepID=A0ABT5SW48_9PSEU|nr:hypothetical protein [Actinomycetospora sp. DW7H6]MDD7967088.1 hypothetical protein [Actinomycetospora sp. DW7H6]
MSDEVGDVGPVELREQTLGVIAALLEAGLFVVGDLGPSGFEPWRLEPEAAVARIRTEWDVPEAPLHAGDACWLQITDKGQALARSLVDEAE